MTHDPFIVEAITFAQYTAILGALTFAAACLWAAAWSAFPGALAAIRDRLAGRP
jgi:hypothetical protein